MWSFSAALYVRTRRTAGSLPQQAQVADLDEHAEPVAAVARRDEGVVLVGQPGLRRQCQDGVGGQFTAGPVPCAATTGGLAGPPPGVLDVADPGDVPDFSARSSIAAGGASVLIRDISTA